MYDHIYPYVWPGRVYRQGTRSKRIQKQKKMRQENFTADAPSKH